MKFRVGQRVRICNSQVPGYGGIGIVKEVREFSGVSLLRVKMEGDGPPFWYNYISRYFELYTAMMEAKKILKRCAGK